MKLELVEIDLTLPIRRNSLTLLLMRGIKPNLCAINSSLSTVLFVSISTRSMAMVGMSTKMIRRSAFATEGSVPLRTNSQLSASKWRNLHSYMLS